MKRIRVLVNNPKSKNFNEEAKCFSEIIEQRPHIPNAKVYPDKEKLQIIVECDEGEFYNVKMLQEEAFEVASASFYEAGFSVNILEN